MRIDAPAQEPVGVRHRMHGRADISGDFLGAEFRAAPLARVLAPCNLELGYSELLLSAVSATTFVCAYQWEFVPALRVCKLHVERLDGEWRRRRACDVGRDSLRVAEVDRPPTFGGVI